MKGGRAARRTIERTDGRAARFFYFLMTNLNIFGPENDQNRVPRIESNFLQSVKLKIVLYFGSFLFFEASLMLLGASLMVPDSP